MRFFVAPGETTPLDERAREGRRGSFVRLPQGVTHYELTGPERGPLLVLVPGLTVPLDFWDDVTGRFHAAGVRTLTYTAYGRGYSDRVRARYDEKLLVDQLGDLLLHLGVSDVHLVASSMGALIATAYAARAEASVASLTLSGPAGLSSQRNPIARLPDRGPVLTFVGKHLLRRNLLAHLGRNVQTAEDAARLRDLVLDGFRFEGSMYALTSTLKHMRLGGRDDVYDAAAHELPPVLLIWGAHDRVTPATGFDRAVELLRPRRSELIDDCGHMASFERPELFSQLVTSFVAELVR